eukprot:GHRQ01005259.1.p1 GENE.GHRQ01005259.1~~GHRQ01005259.1.p1  ORF type:complete len:429 (+),score=103.88 GHRQ01005259.1:79-1365(+)
MLLYVFCWILQARNPLLWLHTYLPTSRWTVMRIRCIKDGNEVNIRRLVKSLFKRAGSVGCRAAVYRNEACQRAAANMKQIKALLGRSEGSRSGQEAPAEEKQQEARTAKDGPAGRAEERPAAPQGPTSFYCPVSMELMSDPVMVATGHTYDRQCIAKWLAQGNRTCPVTGMRLRHLELVPNHALRNAIQEWATAHGISLPNHYDTTNQPTFKLDDHHPKNILLGHEEIVWAVEVYGARLFSASADKTIRVWDIDSRRCEHVLEDHTRPVLSLAISGNRLYSGSYDFTIKVWDLNTLTRVKTLTGHTDAVRALSVSEGRLFSGSYDGTVRVWDEANMHCLEVLKGHNGPVRTLVNRGGCMFSGSYDKTVRVWDVRTLECKAALTGHTGAVRALVASPDYVFSGSDDTTIKVSSASEVTPCWDALGVVCG